MTAAAGPGRVGPHTPGATYGRGRNLSVAAWPA